MVQQLSDQASGEEEAGEFRVSVDPVRTSLTARMDRLRFRSLNDALLAFVSLKWRREIKPWLLLKSPIELLE